MSPNSSRGYSRVRTQPIKMHTSLLKKQQEEKWDKFVHAHPHASIHQTSTWAHFQSNVPSRDKFWIIAITNDKKQITAGTVLVKHRLPKGEYCWLYSSRGPLLSYENTKLAKQQLKALLKEIKSIAKKEKAIFYRADPLLPKTTKPFPRFRSTPYGFQPEDTLIVDLNHPKEKILKQMKSKGRYNIRLSGKKGVEAIEVTTPVLRAGKKETVDLIREFQSKIESYFDILQETLKRDKFYGHSISFYKNMIEKLSSDKKDINKGFAKLYLAQYTPPEVREKKYIAGIIVTFYKDTAIYYYGASSNEHRNVMAPYLLQWHAMQEAKSLGCKYYDFLGIAPPTKRKVLGRKSHPWRGVTEFKRKFGGEHVASAPAQELTFKPWLHFLYKMAKRLRKIARLFK